MASVASPAGVVRVGVVVVQAAGCPVLVVGVWVVLGLSVGHPSVRVVFEVVSAGGMAEASAVVGDMSVAVLLAAVSAAAAVATVAVSIGVAVSLAAGKVAEGMEGAMASVVVSAEEEAGTERETVGRAVVGALERVVVETGS